MKKIALIHYAYPPKIGGVERLMREQAVILSEMGYDVTVLAGSGSESDAKINFVHIPQFAAVRLFDQPLQERIVTGGPIDASFLDLSGVILKELEKNLAHVDVIIVHNMLTLIHNLPFVAAFKSYAQKHPEKKSIVWAHDQTFIDNGRVVDPKIGLTLQDEMRKLLIEPLPNAHYVVISETFKKLLVQVVQISPDKLHVIADGVNIKRFLEVDDAVWDIMQKERLLEAYPLILTPVNILERKNLDYCVDVIAKLVSDYPGIRYVISGLPSEHRDTGNYFEKLKQKVIDLSLERHIFFLAEHLKRALTDGELHDLYDMADLIFYFSKQENFGLPILEAGLSKTPIWVSDLPVFHEIGGDNLTYVPATHTPQQVATQVHEYLKTAKSIGLNRLVRTQYSLETIIKNQLIPLL